LQNQLPSIIHKAVKKYFEKLPETTSELVSTKIVGTTYYKWDIETSYLPTIVFFFQEIKDGLSKRITQIKAKLPYATEKLPIDIVQRLRNKIELNHNIQYKKGSIRANFVHPKQKWKTTIFVSNKQEAINLIQYISNIIEIEPEINGLSYTEQRQASTITRRIVPLPEIDVRHDSLEQFYHVELSRVVLLVNNAVFPILIKSLTKKPFKCHAKFQNKLRTIVSKIKYSTSKYNAILHGSL
jgi:hypothetical protein